MIDINDYNREDLIASCLMEAAEVMSESYEKNGAVYRYLEERYKTEKAKNDAHDNGIKRKREMYKKAGYLDKAPELADRREENDLKTAAKYENNIRHTDSAIHYSDLDKNADYYNRNFYIPNTYADLIEKHSRAEANAAKKAQVNKRINERAERARKAMGESAYDHLDFADAVLDILNDYDY